MAGFWVSGSLPLTRAAPDSVLNPDSGVIEERYGSVLGVWQPTTAEGGVQLIRPVTDDVRKDSGSTSGDFREAPTHNSQWPTSGDNDIAAVTATCIPYSSARHAGGNQRSGAFGRMLLVLMIPVIIAAGVALSFGILDKLEYMSTSATARVDPAVSSASSASEKHPVPLARVIRSSEVIPAVGSSDRRSAPHSMAVWAGSICQELARPV
jgi:hypothetical protein